MKILVVLVRSSGSRSQIGWMLAVALRITCVSSRNEVSIVFQSIRRYVPKGCLIEAPQSVRTHRPIVPRFRRCGFFSVGVSATRLQAKLRRRCFQQPYPQEGHQSFVSCACKRLEMWE